MRAQELVGSQIREVRMLAGMSQAEFGEAVAAFLGDTWRRRQTVSNAETGKRVLDAEEIVTIAHVLQVSVNQLFSPGLPYGLQARAIEVGREGRTVDLVDSPVVWGGDTEAVMDAVDLQVLVAEALQSQEHAIKGVQFAGEAIEATNDALQSLGRRIARGHGGSASEES